MEVLRSFWRLATAESVPLQAYPQELWLLLTVVGVGLACSPRAWRVFGYLTTLAHEGGHALAGLAAGRRVKGISLSGSMAGHTMTAGKERGLGLIWTTWWGYPAPGLLAVGYLWAVCHGRAPAALALTFLGLAAVLLVCRSLGAVLVTGLALGAVGSLLWWGGEVAVTTVTYALGWLLLVGAARSVVTLVRIDLLGERASESEGAADSRALFELTLIPSFLWVASFAATVGAAAVVSGQLLWEHRPF